MGHFVRRDGAVVLDLMLENTGAESDLGDKIAIKLNKNTWALTPAKVRPPLFLQNSRFLPSRPPSSSTRVCCSRACAGSRASL